MLESVGVKWKFMSQLNRSFGSGGMTSALESNTLIEYVQYLQRCHSESNIPIKKGVLIPGFQQNGTCVLNSETFIDANGDLLDPKETDLVWLSRDLVHETSKVTAKDITPLIVHPLSEDPLLELYSLCEKMAKHNLIPTLLVIASGMQCFHYRKIIEAYGCCPIPVAVGQNRRRESQLLW